MEHKTTDIVLVACHSGSLLQSTPLGVGSLCAGLPPFCRSEILNLPPAFDIEHICEAVSALQPKLVGFSMYVWNRARLQDFAYELRTHLPDTVFVAGGPEVSCRASTWEQNSSSPLLYDIVIQGHAELLFQQVVAEVMDGIFVRPAETQVLCETATPLPESPWLNEILTPQRGVLLETARGCPFRCAYCFDARGNRAVTRIPYLRLQQELELFVAHGVEQVWVLDSSFNVPCSRGKELLRLFLEYAPELHYHLEAKAEYIDAEMEQVHAVYAEAGVDDAQLQELVAVVENTAEFLKRAYAGVTLAALGLVYLVTVMVLYVLGRGKFTLPGVEFHHFKVADPVIWLLIASGFSLLLPVIAVQDIALNVLTVLLPLYFVQGVAIVTFYFRKKGFSLLARIFAYTIMLVVNPLPLMVAALGIFDLWFDFRKPRVKTT
ncbi:MAG: DUF2232 domain-containing protein [Desulfuromonadaceae bacterium]